MQMPDKYYVRASWATIVFILLGVIHGGFAAPGTQQDDRAGSENHGTTEHGTVAHEGEHTSHSATNGHGDSHGDDASHGHGGAHTGGDDAGSEHGHDAAAHDEHHAAGEDHHVATSEDGHDAAGHGVHDAAGDDHHVAASGDGHDAAAHDENHAAGEDHHAATSGDGHDAAAHGDHAAGEDHHDATSGHGGSGEEGADGHGHGGHMATHVDSHGELVNEHGDHFHGEEGEDLSAPETWHHENDRGHGSNDPHGSGGHDGVKDHEDGHGHERITKDLLTTFIVWALIWFSGRLASLTGLSPLLFYLILGCVMGNIHLHLLDMEHSDFLHTLAVLAIAIVFFSLGLEENVGHFMEGIKKAWGIAFIGAAVPFCVGLGCTTLFWPDAPFETALMGGLAVTATAVSLTMISLKSEGLASSKPAIGIMTSAVLDDIASLALVAICVPIATGEAAPSVFGICFTVGKAIAFFVVVALVHVFIFPNDKTTGPGHWIPFLRHYGLKDALQWRGGEQAALIALSVGMAWSMIAVGFGFHPAIGAYMGGLIIERDYFQIDEAHLATMDVHHRGTMDNKFHAVLEHVETVAYGWLGPFFFVELGSTVLIDENVLGVIGYSVLFFVLLFIGQFFSAAGAAKYVPGGFNWAEAGMIGFGMMGRAELFFVVLDLCYNQNDIMTKDMFCCFAITAMLMNVSVPVCISLYKKTFLKYSGEFDPETGRKLVPDGDHGHGHAGKDHDEEAPQDHKQHHFDDKEENAREVTAKAPAKDDYDHIDNHQARGVDLDDVDVSNCDNKPDNRFAKQEHEAANGATWAPNGSGGVVKVDHAARQDNATPKNKKQSVVLPMVCGCINAPNAK